ncbi:MAG: Coenzyme F420 hydrogenase/dehydrogenase, beta subunit C-terminal domain [Desulfarculaceae bacterium]|jgi:coenzyme F420 hydrogenase subunit beta
MAPSQAQEPEARAVLDRLKNEVIDAGLCVACGACLGLCPHIIFHDGQVAAPDACGLDAGRCYDLCPQAKEPAPSDRRWELHRASGSEYQPPLGPVLQAWQGRGTDPGLETNVQYGGVVTTLVKMALEIGLFSEAVLTRSNDRGVPEGVKISQGEEVLSAAGTIYAAGGSLSLVNQALAESGRSSLGLVGLPCQVMGAAGMINHPSYPAAAERISMVIGLFCTWNLPVRGLRALLKEQGISGPIIKMDIPPPPAQVFKLTTAAGDFEIPLDEVRSRTLPGCALCPDMTAELADISVGAMEGRPGWNTILARNQVGLDLLLAAQERGLVILEPVQEASMDHLQEAARAKRQRAEQAWKERDHG